MTLKMKLRDMPITAVKPGETAPPVGVSSCDSTNQRDKQGIEGGEGLTLKKMKINKMQKSRTEERIRAQCCQKQTKGEWTNSGKKLEGDQE